MNGAIKSTLLIGPGAENVAEKMIRDYLLVSDVTLHPDLFVVDATNGAGVDEAEEIVRRSGYLPVAASKTIVYIKRMDKMTEQGQNKLLKTIEEVEHVVVVMTSVADNGVLATIKSRVHCKHLNPLSIEEFTKDNSSIPLYYAKAGYKDNDVDETLLSIYENVYEKARNRDIKGLFDILHLTSEKDKANFFLVYKSEVKSLLSLVLNALGDSVDAREVAVIDDNLRRCESIAYTKDNFFICFAELAMIWKE